MTERMDAFSERHPVVEFAYFAAVIVFSMLLNHPILLLLSFLGAISYAIRLKGAGSVLKKQVLISLPLMAIVALINPLFNHYGVTVLFYMKTGPVTLEALIYGMVLSSMLFIAIMWFTCFNVVMTTDKFVYLFGRLLPALSLVLSMIFRFVPRFRRQAEIISYGQRAIGRSTEGKGLIKKAGAGLRILSILITWSLENAIGTSDSMQARGYGLKGRTAFSIYRFRKADGIAGGCLLVLMGIFLTGLVRGGASASYDPVIMIGGLPLTPGSFVIYLAWGLFCFFPLLMALREDAVFRHLVRNEGENKREIWYLTEPPAPDRLRTEEESAVLFRE